MNKLIGISIGDIEGIGIEILLKLYKQKKINNFILFSNKKILKRYLTTKKIKLKINVVNKKIESKLNLVSGSLNIYEFYAKNKIVNTYKSLEMSYRITKKLNFLGIITLPLNKEKIIKNVDKNFMGQTEYFEKIDKVKFTNMLFICKKIIISTLTTHIKLKDVVKKISKKNFVYNKILLLNHTLKTDFNIKKPNFAISGINPHASENGYIGNEEELILKPALKKLRHKITVDGPFSGDSILNKNNLNKYNCFIFHYHDQALIPFKLFSNNSGINFTTGLSIIRISPDHGTAYNLVGKNLANTKSIMNCFNLLLTLSKNRKNNC